MHENNHDAMNDLYKKTSIIYKLLVDVYDVRSLFVNINQLYEVERLKTDDEKMLYLAIPVVL
jgi:hypothetical protein